MDFEQLKSFCTIAKTGNISKAAEILNISQPALSLSLKKLESELNIELFDRVGRKIVLNDFGATFLPDAEKAIQSLNLGISRLGQLKQDKNNTVSLLSPELYEYRGLMERIYQECPDIVIKVNGRFSNYLLMQNNNGRNDPVDMFITTFEEEFPGYTKHHLRDYSMCLIACQSHPLASKKAIEVEDIRNLPLAAKNDNYGTRKFVDAFCAEAGFAPKVVFTVDNNRDIFSAVASGNCLAFVSACPQTERLLKAFTNVTVIPLVNHSSQIPLNLFVRDRKPQKPSVKALCSVFVSYFSAYTDDPTELLNTLNQRLASAD